MANQVSNNTQIYQGAGLGPQGLMAVPVSYDEQHQQHQHAAIFLQYFLRYEINVLTMMYSIALQWYSSNI